MNKHDFSVWISAETWAPSEWQPANDATDVLVTLADGTRWTATFCAYRYVETLRANYTATSECLGGRYLWMANMVLVEDTSRATTEAVVRDLLASGEFQSCFNQAPAEINERAI
jgi:hypothetical protein